MPMVLILTGRDAYRAVKDSTGSNLVFLGYKTVGQVVATFHGGLSRFPPKDNGRQLQALEGEYYVNKSVGSPQYASVPKRKLLQTITVS